MINKFKKIVIKIGSSSIVNEKTNKIKKSWLKSICKDIASIHPNKKIIIVCSGAIALGAKIIKNNGSVRKLEDNLEIWKYKPLNEAERIAGILRSRILNNYNK